MKYHKLFYILNEQTRLPLFIALSFAIPKYFQKRHFSLSYKIEVSNNEIDF